MRTNRRYSNTTIAAGASTAPCRRFDGARTAKCLIRAGLSIITLAAPLALHAQSVSFAGVQSTVPAQGLGKTSSVAADGAGNLYIADNSNGRIVKLTPEGVQTTLPISHVVDVTQLAVDSAGDLFITDLNSFWELRKYSAAGVLTTLETQDGYPVGLAIDNRGDILVADGVQNEVTWAPPSLSSWNNVTNQSDPVNSPNNLAMGPFNPASGTQNVFIANTGYNEVLGVPGSFTSQGANYNNGSDLFTLPTSGLSGPLGVAADNAGDVFIADTGHNRVVELPLTATGYGSQVTVPASGLSKPYGLAMDGAGNLYIADQNNDRVVEMQFHSADFGAVNVCPSGQTTPAPCSNTLTLNFHVTASGTIGTAIISTQGKQWMSGSRNVDFAPASGSTCTGAVTAGSACTVNVTFNPKYAGLRTGTVQLTDSAGNILATTLLNGYGQGPQMAFSQAAQSTVFSNATGQTSVAVDEAGNEFIAEANGTVMEIMAGGSQETVATGLGGGNTLALDGADNLFVADPNNNRVLKITPKLAQTTVGTGLSDPSGAAVDGEGNVFIADSNNNRVVEIQASTGDQFTVGTGLSFPEGVAVDGLGDVYIADTNNHRVVEVSANGAQTTIASGLVLPLSVAVDGAGDVFIADDSQVTEVSANGTQTTVGTGLEYPISVALNGAGDVFIADYGHTRVLDVQRSQPPRLSFASTPVGQTSSDSPQSVTIQNIGNQPLNAASPGLSIGANFEQVAGSGTPEDCTSTFSLAAGASCNLSISFTPATAGSILSSAVLTDNALNGNPATQSITLTGTGVQ